MSNIVSEHKGFEFDPQHPISRISFDDAISNVKQSYFDDHTFLGMVNDHGIIVFTTAIVVAVISIVIFAFVPSHVFLKNRKAQNILSVTPWVASTVSVITMFSIMVLGVATTYNAEDRASHSVSISIERWAYQRYGIDISGVDAYKSVGREGGAKRIGDSEYYLKSNEDTGAITIVDQYSGEELTTKK